VDSEFKTSFALEFVFWNKNVSAPFQPVRNTIIHLCNTHWIHVGFFPRWGKESKRCARMQPNGHWEVESLENSRKLLCRTTVLSKEIAKKPDCKLQFIDSER
jgi:hypothetical protein